MLNVIDKFTRECLTIRVDRKLKSTDVIDVLSDLFSPPGLSPFRMIRRIIPLSATTPAKACLACRAMSVPTTSYVGKKSPLEASDHEASERLDTLRVFAQAGSAVKKWSLP